MKEKKPMIGSWLSSGSPIAAEVMASTGLDFVCIDAEHSSVGIDRIQAIFQAIKSGGSDCLPFIRVPGIDYSTIKRYVDAGAQGIIVPLVNTPEDARVAVDAVKYPPLGKRGVGFCRANRFGLDVKEHFENANQEVKLIVQIEHIEGVERIDEILAVEGVEGVFIGPYDLSASMGIAAQFDNPLYKKARDSVLDACKKAGIAVGIHVVQPDRAELLSRLEDGYEIIAYSLDITVLLNEFSDAIFEINQAYDKGI